MLACCEDSLTMASLRWLNGVVISDTKIIIWTTFYRGKGPSPSLLLHHLACVETEIYVGTWQNVGACWDPVMRTAKSGRANSTLPPPAPALPPAPSLALSVKAAIIRKWAFAIKGKYKSFWKLHSKRQAESKGPCYTSTMAWAFDEILCLNSCATATTEDDDDRRGQRQE